MTNDKPPRDDPALPEILSPAAPGHVIVGHGIIVPAEIAPQALITREQAGQPEP